MLCVLASMVPILYENRPFLELHLSSENRHVTDPDLFADLAARHAVYVHLEDLSHHRGGQGVVPVPADAFTDFREARVVKELLMHGEWAFWPVTG